MIYRRIFIISLLIIIYYCSVTTQECKVDITNYNLQVTLDFLQNQLNVTAILELQKSDVLNEFELLLNSNVKIKSIKSKIKDNWVDISYKLKEDDIIHLIIPSPLIGHNEFTMMFEYTFPIEGPIKDFFYMDRGNRWYPLIIDDVAGVKISAVVPSQYKMFSGGDLIDIIKKNDISTYKWETQNPVFKIPFVLINPEKYFFLSMTCNDKEIDFYFLEDNKNKNRMIVEEACKTFKYFQSKIGEYYHNRLTIIEMNQYKGYSFIATGLILMGSDFMAQFREEHYNGLHLPIAAQWFGAGVFGKFNDEGFWFFSLSLPHYLRLMYIKESKNTDAFVKQLEKPYHDYKEIAGTGNDVPIIDIERIDTREKGLIIYGKGPFLLDLLRREMGEKNWENFIRELYLNYVGKILTYDTFKNNLAKYDKNGNLILKFDRIMNDKGLIEN